MILMNSVSSSSRNFLRISLQTSSKYITPFFSTWPEKWKIVESACCEPVFHSFFLNKIRFFIIWGHLKILQSTFYLVDHVQELLLGGVHAHAQHDRQQVLNNMSIYSDSNSRQFIQLTVHTTYSSYNLQWSWTHSIQWQQTVQGSLSICILGHWWSRSQSRGKLVSDDTEIGTSGILNMQHWHTCQQGSRPLLFSILLHCLSSFSQL